MLLSEVEVEAKMFVEIPALLGLFLEFVPESSLKCDILLSISKGFLFISDFEFSSAYRNMIIK